MALHQALADKPNYRLAQRSMYNLGDLEIVLWEAFSKERFAVAQAETRKLKVKASPACSREEFREQWSRRPHPNLLLLPPHPN